MQTRKEVRRIRPFATDGGYPFYSGRDVRAEYAEGNARTVRLTRLKSGVNDTGLA